MSETATDANADLKLKPRETWQEWLKSKESTNGINAKEEAWTYHMLKLKDRQTVH